MLTTMLLNSQDGTSEELIGEWMELRGNRDQMVIATKVPTPSYILLAISPHSISLSYSIAPLGKRTTTPSYKRSISPATVLSPKK
jgi:hypothetical protein